MSVLGLEDKPTFEQRVKDIVLNMLREPLTQVPDEFKAWLPRWLELQDLTITPAQVTGGEAQSFPIGGIIWWALDTIPTDMSANYQFMIGSNLNRLSYPDLFARWGTTWGAGDGSNTFGTPNLRGRVIVNKDPSQAEFDGLGEVGGAKTVTLSAAESAPHAHAIGADGSHSHQIASGYGVYVNAGGYFIIDDGSGPIQMGNLAYDTSATGIHSHGGATTSAGSGSAHTNLQPYIVLNGICRVL